MRTPVGNSIGNAIERISSVLYSFIGEIPMGVKSIEVEGVVGVIDEKRLIYSVLMREVGSEKTKDEISVFVGIGIEGEGSWRSGPGVVAWRRREDTSMGSSGKACNAWRSRWTSL